MRLARRRESVQPVLRAQEILEALRRQHVVDSEWQDPQLLVYRPFHLAANLRRVIAACGKDQNHYPGFRDRIDDLGCPVRHGRYIARRDPGADAVPLNPRHELERAAAVWL